MIDFIKYYDNHYKILHCYVSIYFISKSNILILKKSPINRFTIFFFRYLIYMAIYRLTYLATYFNITKYLQTIRISEKKLRFKFVDQLQNIYN